MIPLGVLAAATPRAVSSGPGGWDPSQLSNPPKIWYSDESAITTSFGVIASVADLSGNGYTASQSNSTYRPSRVDGQLNGLPVFRFAANWLNGPNTTAATTLISGVNDAWSMAVYKSSSTSGNAYLFNIAHTSSNLTRFLHIASSTSGGSFINRPGVGGRSATADSYSQFINSASVGTSWTIAQARINFPGRIGAVKVNGDTEQSGTLTNMTAAASSTTAQAPFAFGGNNQASGSFSGDVAEYLFGTGTLSSTDVEKLEGYLAWKWGLVSLLPSGHPYKSAAPE